MFFSAMLNSLVYFQTAEHKAFLETLIRISLIQLNFHVTSCCIFLTDVLFFVNVVINH